MRGQSAALDWDEDEIPGPDVSKRETLLLLAKMTSNAYVEPNTDGWYNLTDGWGAVGRLFISYGVVIFVAGAVVPGPTPQHAPVGREPDDDAF